MSNTVSVIKSCLLRAKKKTLTTPSVVVEMTLNITADNTSQGPDEVINLPRVSTPNGVSDTDTVETDLVYGSVDGEEVDKLGSEGVF